MSYKDTLSKEDIRKWIKDSLIFGSPAIIAFLVALQNGIDIKIAMGLGIQALIASAIGLLKKYSAGEPK